MLKTLVISVSLENYIGKVLSIRPRILQDSTYVTLVEFIEHYRTWQVCALIGVYCAPLTDILQLLHKW